VYRIGLAMIDCPWGNGFDEQIFGAKQQTRTGANATKERSNPATNLDPPMRARLEPVECG